MRTHKRLEKCSTKMMSSIECLETILIELAWIYSHVFEKAVFNMIGMTKIELVVWKAWSTFWIITWARTALRIIRLRGAITSSGLWSLLNFRLSFALVEHRMTVTWRITNFYKWLKSCWIELLLSHLWCSSLFLAWSLMLWKSWRNWWHHALSKIQLFFYCWNVSRILHPILTSFFSCWSSLFSCTSTVLWKTILVYFEIWMDNTASWSLCLVSIWRCLFFIFIISTWRVNSLLCWSPINHHWWLILSICPIKNLLR